MRTITATCTSDPDPWFVLIPQACANTLASIGKVLPQFHKEVPTSSEWKLGSRLDAARAPARSARHQGEHGGLGDGDLVARECDSGHSCHGNVSDSDTAVPVVGVTLQEPADEAGSFTDSARVLLKVDTHGCLEVPAEDGRGYRADVDGLVRAYPHGQPDTQRLGARRPVLPAGRQPPRILIYRRPATRREALAGDVGLAPRTRSRPPSGRSNALSPP
nr:hypothetical protein GCM10020092_092390 [Actinoplanes digitatis]